MGALPTKAVDNQGNYIGDLPASVVGPVAHNTVDDNSGIVSTGGVANSAAPTYIEGARVRFSFTLGGSVRTSIWNPTGNAFAAVGVSGRNASTSANGMRANSVPHLYNGTGYDHQCKVSGVSRIASAAASTNATLVKSTAGDVLMIEGYCAAASARRLKIYNKATAPTPGADTPVLSLYLAPNAPFKFTLPVGGLYCSAGIGFAFTVNGTDSDTTALTAGDITDFNLLYA